jgi:hypothetical protein
MHKGYRELLARIEGQAAALPQVQPLLAQVEQLDDLNPLTVPAVKAMLRAPPPPLELTLVRENPHLVLYARNTARKRRASQATRAASIECPPWLFDPQTHREPEVAESLRLELLALVKESFTLLGHRISNSFAVTFRDELVIHRDPLAYFTVREVPLAERTRLNPESRVTRSAV